MRSQKRQGRGAPSASRAAFLRISARRFALRLKNFERTSQFATSPPGPRLRSIRRRCLFRKRSVSGQTTSARGFKVCASRNAVPKEKAPAGSRIDGANGISVAASARERSSVGAGCVLGARRGKERVPSAVALLAPLNGSARRFSPEDRPNAASRTPSRIVNGLIDRTGRRPETKIVSRRRRDPQGEKQPFAPATATARLSAAHKAVGGSGLPTVAKRPTAVPRPQRSRATARSGAAEPRS
jgi:hypothetical protein